MKKNIFSAFIIVCFMLILLTGCENFMDGGEFMEKLNKDIDYAAATPVTIFTACKNNEGIITSPSPVTKKKTDTFTVIFQPSEATQFLNWEAVYRDTETVIDDSQEASEHIISFIDEDGKDWSRSLECHVFLTGTASSEILIRPVCNVKPAVVSRTPEQSNTTIYSKNNSIIVKFSTIIDPESFFFTEEEMQENYALYEPFKNSNGEIYAYGFTKSTPIEKTAFKNIYITSEGHDLYSNFYDVTLSTKEETTNNVITRYSELVIKVDPDNPISVTGNTKLIRVEIGSKVKDLLGTEILVNDKLIWYYSINNKTEEQSKIQFALERPNSGTITPSRTDAADYNTLENLPISFTPNDDYVFKCWEISSEAAHLIKIDNEFASETFLTPLAQSNYILIKALTYERPKVISALPVYNETNPAFINDSIVITFNKEVPESNFFFTDTEINTIQPNGGTLESGGKIYAYRNNNVLYFKNIEIEDADGKNILKYFDCPVWNEETKKLTIPVHEPDTSKNETYINFGLNENYKAINVTLSESITDQDSISFFKSYTFTYTICNTTSTQTRIVLDVDSKYGRVIPEYKAGQNFNIHDTFDLTFIPSDGYSFDYWNISENTDTENNEYVTIADINSAVTTATVNAFTSKAVNITPVVKTKPVLSEYSPKNLDSTSSFAKDTPLVLKFSKIIDEKNFYYSAKEIRELQGMKYTQKGTRELDGETYYCGYITSSQGNAFYKNVSITDSEGRSVCEHYLAPVVTYNGTTTIVTYNVDDKYRSNNSVWFNYFVNPEDKTEIFISVSNNIKDSEGLPLYENYDWTYTLNKNTREQTQITFTTTEGIGTITPEGTLAYNKHDSFDLDFKKPLENSNSYKLLAFKSSSPAVSISNIIELDNGKTYDATVTVNEYVSSGVTIYADLIGVSPKFTEEGVVKDSEIIIDFYRLIQNENLSELIQLKDSSNNSLASYFDAPVLTTTDDTHKSTLTISPKQLIPFSENYKDIYVTVSKDIDATIEKDITFTYRINSQTSNKTKVLTTCTPGSGNVTASASGPYNIGQIFTVTFDCSPDYQFLNWTSSDPENITITNSENTRATVTVNKYVLNQITVTANAQERPVIESNYSPVYQQTGVPKDSDIVINFSKSMDPNSFFFTEAETDTAYRDEKYKVIIDGTTYYTAYFNSSEQKILFKAINISSGTENLLEKFTPQFSDDNKTLTLVSDKENFIAFEENQNYKDIVVSVSSNITDTQNARPKEGKTWKYRIINETKQKTAIDFEYPSTLGSLTISRTGPYNIHSTVEVVFNLGSYTQSSNFVFTGFKSNSNSVSIKQAETEIEKLEEKNAGIFRAIVTINSYSAETVKVYPSFVKFTPDNIETGVERDTDLQFTFFPALDLTIGTNYTDKTFYFKKEAASQFIEQYTSSGTETFLETDSTGYSYIKRGNYINWINLFFGNSCIDYDESVNNYMWKQHYLQIKNATTNGLTVLTISSTGFISSTYISSQTFRLAFRNGYKDIYGNEYENQTFEYRLNMSTIKKDTINYVCSNNTAEFTHDKEGPYNIGETIKLTFTTTAESDCKFTGFTSSNSAVTISAPVKNTPYAGVEINTATATVSSYYANTITITANTRSKFSVSECLPVISNEGVLQDEPIVINFTKALKADSIFYTAGELTAQEKDPAYLCEIDETDYYTAKIKNNEIIYKNMSIRTGSGLNLSEYFMPPEISSNKKTLTFRRYGRKAILAPTDSISQVVVTVNKEIEDNTDNLSLGLDNDSNDFTYSFYYSPEREKIPPVTGDEFNLIFKKDNYSSRALSANVFGTANYDYHRNHISDTIYIKPDASDNYGINKLIIKETYYKTESGADALNPVTKITEVLNNSSQTAFPTDMANYIEYKIDTDVNNDSVKDYEDDGVYKLDFIFEDYAGNQTEAKTYYVIKDLYLRANDFRISQKLYKGDYKVYTQAGFDGEIDGNGSFPYNQVIELQYKTPTVESDKILFSDSPNSSTRGIWLQIAMTSYLSKEPYLRNIIIEDTLNKSPVTFAPSVSNPNLNLPLLSVTYTENTSFNYIITDNDTGVEIQIPYTIPKKVSLYDDLTLTTDALSYCPKISGIDSLPENEIFIPYFFIRKTTWDERAYCSVNTSYNYTTIDYTDTYVNLYQNRKSLGFRKDHTLQNKSYAFTINNDGTLTEKLKEATYEVYVQLAVRKYINETEYEDIFGVASDAHLFTCNRNYHLTNYNGSYYLISGANNDVTLTPFNDTSTTLNLPANITANRAKGPVSSGKNLISITYNSFAGKTSGASYFLIAEEHSNNEIYNSKISKDITNELINKSGTTSSVEVKADKYYYVYILAKKGQTEAETSKIYLKYTSSSDTEDDSTESFSDFDTMPPQISNEGKDYIRKNLCIYPDKVLLKSQYYLPATTWKPVVEVRPLDQDSNQDSNQDPNQYLVNRSSTTSEIPINYWVIPSYIIGYNPNLTYDQNQRNNPITLDDLNSKYIQYKKTSIQPADSYDMNKYMTFYYDTYYEGELTIFLELEDKLGNKGADFFFVHNKMTGRQPDFSFNCFEADYGTRTVVQNGEIYFEIPNTSPKLFKISHYSSPDLNFNKTNTNTSNYGGSQGLQWIDRNGIYESIVDPDNREWQDRNIQYNKSNGKYTGSGYEQDKTISVQPTLNSTNYNYWRKINVARIQNPSLSGIDNYDLSYQDDRIFTPFYYNPQSYAAGGNHAVNDTITCASKNVMEMGNGYQIFSDHSVLVQALWSSYDLDNISLDDDDAETWCNHGVECDVWQQDLSQSGGSFTYRLPDEIPQGKYYCIIVHFIDHTIYKTPARIK